MMIDEFILNSLPPSLCFPHAGIMGAPRHSVLLEVRLEALHPQEASTLLPEPHPTCPSPFNGLRASHMKLKASHKRF